MDKVKFLTIPSMLLLEVSIRIVDFSALLPGIPQNFNSLLEKFMVGILLSIWMKTMIIMELHIDPILNALA
ncbi:MAG: hypothetical protein D6698_12055 [Gammaproteobacteria bacterium]|nr:MAG: hypothetical protein D6698_12055 [Gammaproteobacteria bacterium]